MSLVIASNEIAGTSNIQGQFQSAFSWSNHMNQPIKLPPNSEVAVQSLKINKDGTITINPSTIFYLYYGVKLADGSITLENTTSALHITDLGVSGVEEVSVEELASKIQTSLNKALPTPETFGMAKCEALRNASQTDFTGFTMTFESRTNGSALNNIPQTWNNVYSKYIEEAGLTFDPAQSTLTPIANYAQRKGKAFYNVAIGTDTPLSLNEGIYEVDLTNAGGCAWGVGLRRCVGVKDRPLPDIYDSANSELGYSDQFADFCVYAVQDNIGGAGQNFKLRAYNSGVDSSEMGFFGEDPVSMKEVDYSGGDFDDIYNWSSNASGITAIRFTVKNEEVVVDLLAGATVYNLLTNTGAKGSRYLPVRDTCRNLYPMAFCTQNASNNRKLKINKWSGREITDFKYSHPENDWWAYLSQNDLEMRDALPVETRDFMDKNTGTTHTYRGINASGVMAGYDYVAVLRPDPTLYTDSTRANADHILGFPRVSVLSEATKSGTNLEISKYTSSSAPQLKSTSSLFVRLNNLPVKSFNAGQSRRSQVIYSAPRFSSGTDQSVGALFMESPEKTYIAIDNLSEINLNTIDIDIVNEDETLATDLLGKSVCVLHFRERK